MAVIEREESPYWQIDFVFRYKGIRKRVRQSSGILINRSSKTAYERSRQLAEECEHDLREHQKDKAAGRTSEAPTEITLEAAILQLPGDQDDQCVADIFEYFGPDFYARNVQPQPLRKFAAHLVANPYTRQAVVKRIQLLCDALERVGMPALDMLHDSELIHVQAMVDRYFETTDIRPRTRRTYLYAAKIFLA